MKLSERHVQLGHYCINRRLEFKHVFIVAVAACLVTLRRIILPLERMSAKVTL